MYTYQQPIPSTISEILTLHSQEDIFKIVFGEYPDVADVYVSPFRKDRNPGCFFEWYKGRLMFRDYADKRRDCFQAVMDYYNLPDIRDSFAFIVNYFDANPVDKSEYYLNKERTLQESDPQKVYPIFIKTRGYEKRDELHWKQYGITEQQLYEDAVYPISLYRFYSSRKKTWITIKPFDICYAISGFESGTMKIYRPYSRNKKSKWLTNCKPNNVGNIDNLPQAAENLIITKSYKDHRVIKNLGYNCVWVQSEKMFPSVYILDDLANRFEDIYIFFDNDETGVEGANMLKNEFTKLNKKTSLLFSPFIYFKDPAEIHSVKGQETLKDLLWKYCHL